MTASTSVKLAVSSMVGAPTLNGTAGSLIALLDAFLVHGFGTKAVDSAQVTSGVCRMAITGASSALDHCVIQLAGVTGSGAVLNGLQRVKTAAASYVEFACDLPDGALTGTITFKIAPLGWEKVFSKTNVAVYRPTDARGTRPYIRVDDTNALYARVQQYELMTEVDAGVGVSPAIAGGYFWHKRQSASTTGVYWVLLGDAQGFYPCIAPGSASVADQANYAALCPYVGDLSSYRSGDAWCSFLSGATDATWTGVAGCVFQSGAIAGRTTMRGSHGIGAAITCDRVTFSSGTSGAVAALGAFPSRVDNGLRLTPTLIMDGATVNGPRGELPGAFFCPQSEVNSVIGTGVRFTAGQGAFTGKTLLSLTVGAPNSQSGNGIGFFDISGPWRD